YISPAIDWRSRATLTGNMSTLHVCGTRYVASCATWNSFMTFSIRTTIRALLVPDHRISCRTKLWRQVLENLERRGEHRHESGVFLLGQENGERMEIKDAIYYDELDPEAYSTGVCV